MAFELKFTTHDYDQGKSIMIVDASTDVFPVISEVTYTITSLYDGVVLNPSPATKTIVTVLAAGFQHEITNVDLGFGATETIPDGVYHIVMDNPDTADTYTSDEVVYYNALYTRDLFISSKASYIDDVYNKDMEYANWLDFLITSIESNTIKGNSSAVYFIFDIFSRLNS
jgi:hypothetical protein